jgi:predicted nucleotidyltransferase
MKTVELLKRHEREIKERFGVKKIGIFGSHARGEERTDSDVDVLVEFKEGYATFDNFMELKFLLEELFTRSVDLVTVDALRPRLREAILQEVSYV